MGNHFSSAKYLIREGVVNTWSNRLMSIASIGVLVCCLVLMGAASLVSININSIMDWVDSQNVIKVFIADGTDAARVTEIGVELENISNVRNCEFISKDAALADMMSQLDQNLQTISDLQMGENNPLPDAYRVTVNDLSAYDITLKHIQDIEGVESITDKREYARKLTSLNRMVTLVGFAVVGLLFVVSLFIITNTIKLTMYVRKLEISIMKSVGATNWFIRVPFMIEGMIIGFISGVISFFITWGIYTLAVEAVQKTVNTIALISFSKIAWWVLLAFTVSGMVVGSLGSGISITKYLRKEGGVYRD